MSNTAVRKIQLNHLEQAVRKMTAMEMEMLNRLEMATAALKQSLPEQPETVAINDEIAKGKKRINYIREIMSIVGRDAGDFVLTETRLADLVNAAADKIIRQFPQCRISLQLSGEQELSMKLAAEPFALVIETLMTNSCEACLNAGRQELTVDIEFSTRKNTVCLRYQDNGPGIPEKLHENIFDPFAAKESDKVGIGLAASRLIMEKMMGGLFFDLNHRDGACFNIKLVKPQP